MNYKRTEEIEGLFIDATKFFNVLGLWVYGKKNPKIVYPFLKSFLDRVNKIKINNDDFLSGCINSFGDDLLNVLKEGELIDPNFQDIITVKHSEKELMGIFLMWRLGDLMINTFTISETKKVSLNSEFMKGLIRIFDVFGKWIFADNDINIISKSIKGIEKALGDTHNVKAEFCQKCKKVYIIFYFYF